MKAVVIWFATLLPLGASAHDGHGLGGTHWHATDTLGFVVLALAITLAIWASRRK